MACLQLQLLRMFLLSEKKIAMENCLFLQQFFSLWIWKREEGVFVKPVNMYPLLLL